MDRRRLFPFALCLVAFSGTCWSSEIRTFTDLRGLSLRGELTQVSGSMVTIKRADGQTFHLSATTFCTADQEYFKSHSALEPWVNSLGMKFTPVSGTKVLFCIHDTRKADYRKYAEAKPGLHGAWEKPTYKGLRVSDGEDHPVVMVNWEDAKGFCDWLSAKEGRTYRLPTDEEWSDAVGIGEQEDAKASPASKSLKMKDVYPWGTTWPPPEGSGNLADSALQKAAPDEAAIAGYSDGFVTTAPVMSFKPNKAGLYDMAGNVLQWCEDWNNPERKERVARGSACLRYGPDRSFFFSSRRASVTRLLQSVGPPRGQGLPYYI